MAAKSRLYWLDCAPVGRVLPPNINIGCWVPDATQGMVTGSPSCTVSVVGGLRMIVSSLLAVAGGGEREGRREDNASIIKGGRDTLR